MWDLQAYDIECQFKKKKKRNGFPLRLVIRQNPIPQVIELDVNKSANKVLIDFVDNERYG